MYQIQLAKKKNLKDIIKIKKLASIDLNEQNIDQWQYGYPLIRSLIKDIEKKNLYLLKRFNKVIGMMVVTKDIDENYENIYQGKWRYSNYISIHRLAILSRYRRKNLSKKLFNHALLIAKKLNKDSIRIDTHEKNNRAQKAFLKNNFQYSGIIYLNIEKGEKKRFAYEKKVKN